MSLLNMCLQTSGITSRGGRLIFPFLSKMDDSTGPSNTPQQVHYCSSFQIYSTVSVIFCCCIFQLQICFSDHFKIRLSRRRKHPGSRQRCKQWKGTWINSSHLLLYQQRVFVRSVWGGTRSFEEPGLAESEILRL